jgi:general secretion pathway protein G
MKRTESKGFTLIELLVVIAIIGILSSVVLASLNTARLKSRDAKRISDMKQLQLALEFSFDADNSYPVQAAAVIITSALGDLVTDGYIAILPEDPQSTNDQYFYISADGTSYCVGAKLEGTGNVLDTCTADVLPGNQDFTVGP